LQEEKGAANSTGCANSRAASAVGNRLLPFGIKVFVDWVPPKGQQAWQRNAGGGGSLVACDGGGDEGGDSEGGADMVEPFQPFFRVVGDPIELALQPPVLMVISQTHIHIHARVRTHILLVRALFNVKFRERSWLFMSRDMFRRSVLSCEHMASPQTL
jgi:hypothetical protein